MDVTSIRTDSCMKEVAGHGTAEWPISVIAGDSYTPDMGIVAWHWHDDFELTYLESGHFEFSVGADTFVLNPKEAVFINSKVLHQIRLTDKNPAVYYSYVFSSEMISESIQNLISRKYITPLMNNRNFPYQRFHHNVPWEISCIGHIQKLNQCVQSGLFEREFLMRHHLQSVFIDMIQNCPGICTEHMLPSDHSSHIIMKIMLFIKQHYQESVTLDDMAGAANISKSSCNRIFHQMLKTTPFGYLLTVRINQSRLLLAHSTLSVTEIAYACGFHDASYYCRMFRKHAGVSPQKYRNDNLYSSVKPEGISIEKS